MSKKVIKWTIVGYVMLLVFVAVTPSVTAEKNSALGNVSLI